MKNKNDIRNKYRMIYRSYRRPTFLSGLASLFDLYKAKSCQNLYTSNFDDFNVIANDFKVTGVIIAGTFNNNAPKKYHLVKELVK